MEIGRRQFIAAGTYGLAGLVASNVSQMKPDEIRKHQLDLDIRLKEFRAVIEQYIIKTSQQ